MALDVTNEPYTTLIPMVRSEVGDLTIGVSQEDTEFTDEDIGKQINNAFLLQLGRDFILGDNKIVSGNLTEDILSDQKLLYPLVILSAQRLISIRLQSATADNIDISRSGKKITLQNLVKGLQNAHDRAGKSYRGLIVSGATGKAFYSDYSENDGISLVQKDIK